MITSTIACEFGGASKSEGRRSRITISAIFTITAAAAIVLPVWATSVAAALEIPVFIAIGVVAARQSKANLAGKNLVGLLSARLWGSSPPKVGCVVAWNVAMLLVFWPVGLVVASLRNVAFHPDWVDFGLALVMANIPVITVWNDMSKEFARVAPMFKHVLRGGRR